MRAWLLAAVCATTALNSAPGESQLSAIKELNLVHFSHTDVGFTDHPAVCRELYRRYLDVALDVVLDSVSGPPERRFYWTAEATMPVNDWWQAATPARRKQFLKAARAGQLEVTALAFNNTPFMNGAQWQTMLHWLPDDLWAQVQPKVAIQNDVNGLPRAAAVALLDRGVRYLFTVSGNWSASMQGSGWAGIVAGWRMIRTVTAWFPEPSGHGGWRGIGRVVWG